MKDETTKLDRKVECLETEIAELKKQIEDLLEGRTVGEEVRARAFILVDPTGKERGRWEVENLGEDDWDDGWESDCFDDEDVEDGDYYYEPCLKMMNSEGQPQLFLGTNCDTSFLTLSEGHSEAAVCIQTGDWPHIDINTPDGSLDLTVRRNAEIRMTDKEDNTVLFSQETGRPYVTCAPFVEDDLDGESMKEIWLDSGEVKKEVSHSDKEDPNVLLLGPEGDDQTTEPCSDGDTNQPGHPDFNRQHVEGGE